MKRKTWITVTTICLFTVFAIVAVNSAPPYGPPIALELAKKVMDAAEQKALDNKWNVAITIVDSGGNLVMFHKFDNTDLGSIELSIGKAKTAANFRQSSKNFEDRIAQGGIGLKLTRFPGLPMEGGLPLIQEGKVIGAIGVSGATSTQDGEVALAGEKSLEQENEKTE